MNKKCPRNKFGMYNPEKPVLKSTGQYPLKREFIQISKRLASTQDTAYDIAYNENIEDKRYLLWRIDKNDPRFKLYYHKGYWCFEYALITENEEYDLRN